MANKAIEVLEELWRYGKTEKYTEAQIRKSLEIAIKAIEIIDLLGETVYRDEDCQNKSCCYDYIGYHCATCIFSPKRQREIEK